ncbi:MAG: hypothetical protein M1840_000567 [Geoglossum simile]|nr:MAG: hypothetical protein M1840_000567 [Geoglossum simile]
MILPLPKLPDGDLPQAEGPKLGPFRHNGGNIKFLSLLGSGKHGYVFEVIIESQRYALKIFKFYNPLLHEPLTLLDIPSDAITYQVDPFFAECRAFGCLIDNDLNGSIGVSCYGYIKLPIESESKLAGSTMARDSGGFYWDRLSQDQGGPSQPEPFRAIVKELVSDVPSTFEMVQKMGADLENLNKIGIFARDIRRDNYRGGRFADFSASWTFPHVMLSFRGYTELAIRSQWESFYEMIQGMISAIDTPLKYGLIAFM